PHLHRAFVLPSELGFLLANVLPESVASGGVAIQAAAKELPQLPGWPSPFNQVYWSRTDVGLNVAGLADFLLLLVSAASFALPVLAPAHPARAGGAAARFAVWALFAVLGGLNVRFIGFFAIVAGPALVLNVQSYLHLRQQLEGASSRRRPALG